MRKGRLNNRERDQLKRVVDLMNRCIDQREEEELDPDSDEATSSLCTAVVAMNDYFYFTRGE